MSFIDRNREILQKQYGGLWEELNKKDDDDLTPEDIKIDVTSTGDPTLCVKGVFIHSQRDPVREGQRLAESISGENGTVIILGFGLGYVTQAATALGACSESLARQIIVVEKYKSLILKALELRDFSHLLSKNRIIFVVGGSGDGIINGLSIANSLSVIDGKTNDNKRQNPSIIRNRALNSLDEQWYRLIEDKIRTWSMRDEVNTATHKRFGRRWVRNLSRNKSAIRDYPGVSHLAGLADVDESLPVFLAAAGPGLDRIKPLLRDIYDRCIIVAVDTSLRFFVNNGIQPDFVLVIDPQFWNSRHLDRCCDRDRDCGETGEAPDESLNQTALIAESAVYPSVLNLPFKNIFLCGSLFPLGEFIEKRTCPKGRLGAGGSVATTAWDFARTLGANEIWIAGLDLAFPDLKTHFRGARFEESSNAQSNRLNPTEKWVVRALRDGKPFKALSANGGQVLTDQRLSLYAAWFENQFRQNPLVQNYSFSPDGLAIAGLSVIDTDKFLSLPKRRDKINSYIQAAFSRIQTEFNDPVERVKRAERYENTVSVLSNGLKNIKVAAEEGAEITHKALRYPLNSSQQEKIIKQLDKIMKNIKESEVKDVAGFLFPPMEEQEDEKDQFRAYLKSLHGLFSGIIAALEINI